MRRPTGLLVLAVVWFLALAAEAREPLKVPDIPEFYQRVLTLPDARILREPSAQGQAIATPPVFTVLYVYGRRNQPDGEWLAVGPRAEGEPVGFLRADQAQDWKTMLVMQYAPRGQRERVMVFRDRDRLAQIVRAPNARNSARALLEAVGAGKADASVLAAVEPAEAIDYRKAPYLMPILDWKVEEFDDGTRTTLTRIASVTTQKNQPRKDDPARVSGDTRNDKPVDTKAFRIGIVFVVDTTLSMGPYIERTRETIRRVYGELERDKTVANAAFGLVAYRNSTSRDARVEYVTRIVQPLDPKAAPADILKRLADVKEASVPTPGWDEDAFAGLYDAMNGIDWTPFQARLVVLVTDAGALPGKSPLARYKNVDAPNIVELANRKSITIFPIHLLTPEGARVNNHARAREQYRAIGRTGDANYIKYAGIEAGSVQTFAKSIDEFARIIRVAVAATEKDWAAQRQAGSAAAVQASGGQPAGAGQPAAAPIAAETELGKALINEIFRARLEYIGAQEGTQAPLLVAGWVPDRDLANPKNVALETKVFLTRNQINGLAQSLNRVVDQAKRASLAPETFFDLLQSLSATMSADPGRAAAAGQFANLAESNLLPSYLRALPYRSKVLRITKQSWVDLGITGQQEFIDELEYKLKLYQDMYQDEKSWVDFGAGDPGLAAYAVPLETLP